MALWRSEIIIAGELSRLTARAAKVLFSADVNQRHISKTSHEVAVLLTAAIKTQEPPSADHPL